MLLGLKRVIDHAPAELGDELRAMQDITRGSLDEVRQVARIGWRTSARTGGT